MVPKDVPTAQLAAHQIAAQCEAAAILAGRAAGIPENVLPAIALVESGRRGEDGRVHPWPWSINVEGTDHVFESRAAAIAAVRQFQVQGIRSIDVGCLQVNLLHHPNAFASLDQAFDPMANATYAAHFLHDLHTESGSWAKAIAAYHSSTPALGETYRRRVMAAMGGVQPADGLGLAGSPHSLPASALHMPGWMAARRLSQQTALAHPPDSATNSASALGGMVESSAVPNPPSASSSAQPRHDTPLVGATSNRGLDSYRARPVWNSRPAASPG